MKEVYINGMGCVSGQDTLSEEFLAQPIDQSQAYLIYTKQPDYKSYIPAGAIRRLEKGVKNSIVASTKALEGTSSTGLDGIITGTGMGCILDSEKFLTRLIELNEEYLTPTAFIQSTHNTVGGQIALGLKCNAYNFTYVSSSNSFQSALFDAWMQIKFEEKNKFLVGGVDEIGEYTFQFFEKINRQKQEKEKPFDILNKRSKGAIAGEGAAFFVVENIQMPSSFAKIVDITSINSLAVEKTHDFIAQFLERNHISPASIDALILGNNGDIDYDPYYDEGEMLFKQAEKVYFKHLFGEFFTAPAIALWIGARMIKEQIIPAALYRSMESRTNKELKKVLIFTQYEGRDLSLILLENV